jgi:hypothetical protein
MHAAHLQYWPAGYEPFLHVQMHSTHVCTASPAPVRVYCRLHSNEHGVDTLVVQVKAYSCSRVSVTAGICSLCCRNMLSHWLFLLRPLHREQQCTSDSVCSTAWGADPLKRYRRGNISKAIHGPHWPMNGFANVPMGHTGP